MNWLESQQVRFLPLELINDLDTTFALTPVWALWSRGSLCASFPQIITPLLLQQCPTGIRIVSGFRRFASARGWGLKAVPALFAAPRRPEPELIRVVIAENRAQRNLSTLETATILGKLRDHWQLDHGTLRREYLPLLGLPAEEHHLRRQLRLARLPELLQRGLGTIEEEILLGIATWPEPDQEFLLGRLASLRLGRNKQMQLWRLLEEVRDLRGVSQPGLAGIWEEAGCGAVEMAESLSPADRFQSIWQLLRALRYPRLTELEARQENLTRALALPSGLGMRLPHFFEGDRIEFQFSGRAPEEVGRFAQALLEASRRKEMAQLFELL